MQHSGCGNATCLYTFQSSFAPSDRTDTVYLNQRTKYGIKEAIKTIDAMFRALIGGLGGASPMSAFVSAREVEQYHDPQLRLRFIFPYTRYHF
jgi:hypothetical protein